MSKQPVRVVAPAPPPAAMMQAARPRAFPADMKTFAERQQKQIEANKVDEDRRTRARTVGTDVRERLQATRRGVAEGEMELSRLRDLEREAHLLRARNEESSKSYNNLQHQFESHEAQFRQVCSRVYSLRAQVDELRRRKERARSDAAEINRSVQCSIQARQQMIAPKQVREELNRPRASVEPFKVQHIESEEVRKRVVEHRTDIPMTSVPLVVCSTDDSCSESSQSTVPSPPAPPRTKATSPSPSPPKDPKPSVAPPPVPPPPSRHEVPQPVTIRVERPAVLPMEPRSQPSGDPLEEQLRLRTGKTDIVSLRPHSIQAAKRRSWASSDTATTTEIDTVRRALLDAQLRGQSHFMPSIPSMTPLIEKAVEMEDVVCEEPSTIAPMPTSAQEKQEPEQASPPAVPLSTPVPTSTTPVADSTTDEESSGIRSDDDACKAAEHNPSNEALIRRAASFLFVDEAFSGHMYRTLRRHVSRVRGLTPQPKKIEVVADKKAVKGILRTAGLKKERRRIKFDPLALLLDAALEGDLDLVKNSADELGDVSGSNDEGITALHNAICAGHYEIVKFLVDKYADVNAQDSDGWTPLHCAASCNNLPMIRLLVEGGACLHAATLSDMETPIEKCEESEEGYERCLNYMLAAHNASGFVNGGRVYAAHSYDAQLEDELSFEAGDELRVLRKDDEEQGWWRCEKRLPDGSILNGLAPRTYLALYPAPKYRERLSFVPFLIPLEANNNADKLTKA